MILKSGNETNVILKSGNETNMILKSGNETNVILKSGNETNVILKPQFVCLLLAEHPQTGGVYTSNNIIISVCLFSDYTSV